VTTDYTLGGSVITIPAGSTSGSFTLASVGDILDEPDETVVLEITAVTNGSESGTQQATVTISDDDASPSVAFAQASQASGNESGSLTATVQLSTASSLPVTVPFTVSGTASGADYGSLTASPLTIAAGSTSATISFTISADSLDEAAETVVLTLGAPTNATQGGITTHTATITDDDVAPTVAFTAAASANPGESGTITATVQLPAMSGLDITVPFAISGTADGDDYAAMTASPLTIVAGSTTATVSFTITADTLDEGDETVILTLGAPTNATAGTPSVHTVTIADDDAVSFSVADLSVAEGAGTAQVAVTMTGTSSQAVSLSYATTSGTAGTDDFTATSGSLTWPAGTTGVVKIAVPITHDTLDEDDETFTVTISAPTPTGSISDATAIVTITDDDAAPTLSFVVASQSVSEGVGTAQLAVVLSSASGKTVTATVGTTPASSSDFSVGSSLSLAPGATTATISVSITDDGLVEGVESFDVALSGFGNASAGTTTTQTVTITDNDVPGLAMQPAGGITVTEGGSTAMLAVRLTAVPTADVTVTMSSSATQEAAVQGSSTLTFTDTTWNTWQFVLVNGVDDTIDDGDKGFTIQASAANGGFNGVTATLAGVCTDDDSAGVLMAHTGGATSVSEAGATDTLLVSLVSAPTGTVEVTINPNPQLRYNGAANPASVSLFFAAAASGTADGLSSGNALAWNSAASVTVNAVDDADDEAATHTASIDASAPGYVGSISPVSVSIADNDTAGFDVTAPALASIAESGGVTTCTIRLTSRPTGIVQIACSSADASELTASPATVTFLNDATDWNTPKTITLTAVNDAIDDGNQAVGLILAPASSSDPLYAGKDPADQTLTVTDDESAGFTVVADSPELVTEGGTTASFTVVLTSQPTGEVTLPLGVSDAQQLAVSPAELHFSGETWDVPQTVTITGRDEDAANNTTPVAVSVLTGQPSSPDPLYNALTATSVTDVAVQVVAANAAPLIDMPVIATLDEGGAPVLLTLTGIGAGQSGETQALTMAVVSSDPAILAVSGISAVSGGQATCTLTPSADLSGSVSLTISVTDDATINGDVAKTTTVVVSVSVAATDDTPVVDANGPAGGSDASGAVFTEGGLPAPTCPALTLSDLDSANLVGASAVLAATPDGTAESLAVITGSSGIVAAYEISSRTLSLSGTASLAAYQDVLRSLTYRNDDDDPDTTLRSIAIQVQDGSSTATAASATVAVQGSNDAPVVSGSASLAAVDEDATDPPGTLISVLTTALTITDADGGSAERGLAIIGADASHGSWGYSLDDGASWTPVGMLAGDAALVLEASAGTKLRFVPATDFVGSATATVRAWDRTNGASNGATGVNASIAGGTNAFSTATAQLSVSVAGGNDPPTISGTAAMTAILEDDQTSAGTLISALIPGLGISDPDAGALRGVAVVAADLAHGSWQYTLDGGTNWATLADGAVAVAEGGARLLGEDAVTRIRFVPQTDFVGTATLTVKAWDQTSGTVGNGSFDTLTGTACSAGTGAVIVTVDPVNDAPVSTAPGGIGHAFNAISEDILEASNTGTTVASLIEGVITDVDANAAQGIAVISTSGTGTWRYRISSGAGWVDFPTVPSVSLSNALLLSDAGTVLVQYLPAPDEKGTFALTYRAWDRTSGVNGGIADATTSGGTTAFGTADIVSTIDITAVYGVTITPTGGTTDVVEGGGTDTYTITLATAPAGGETVTVSLIVPAGLQASVGGSASAVFTDSNWNSPQSVTVSAVQDTVDNGARTLTITHSSLSSLGGGAGFSTVAIAGMPVHVTDDDSAGLGIAGLSSATVTEAGSTATFTVVLATQPSADITIGIANPDSGEIAISASALVFTPADWNQAQTVTITGINDNLDDGDVATIITCSVASGDAAYLALAAVQRTVTTIDDDAKGVAASPTSITVDEGGGTATVAITLASQPTGTVSVALALGGATDEASLSIAALSFTPANWATVQTVTVTGVDDATTDGDQNFSVIATASGADYAGQAATVIGVNRDDDVAAVVLRQTGGSTVVVEGGTTDTITVSLSIQPTADVTVTLAVDANIAISPTTLTFTPLNFTSIQTVTVTAMNDQVAEGNHAGTITVAGVTGAAEYAVLTGLPNLVATIADNDVAAVAVTPLNGLVVSEAGGSATFQIAMATQPTAPVTFAVASADASAATASPASVTFTAADWQSARTITVTGVNDAIDDGDQPFSIIIDSAATTAPEYASLNPSDPTGLCTDDDTAGVVITPTSGLVSSESVGGVAYVTVQLTSQPVADVQINLASSDTLEATVPSSIAFTTANWNQPQSVPVTGVNDVNPDGLKPWTIQTSITSADGLYAAINPIDPTGNNVDDDSPGVLVTATGLLVTEASGGTPSLTYLVGIALAPSAGETVTIDVASSGLGVGQVSVTPVQLTFDQMNWMSPQTVTVTAIDDAVAESTLAAPIAHAVTSSGGSQLYNGVSTPDLIVTVIDNDQAGVTVSPTSGLATTEIGGTATFTVVLDTQPTVDVVINLASTDLSQGTVSPAQLTFTPGNWAAPQTVTVTGADSNGIEDGNVLYGVAVTMRTSGSPDPVYATIDPTDVTVTNLNVSNPPTMAVLADLTIAEDAVEQSVTLSGISNGQPLSETGVVSLGTVVLAESTTGLITGLAVDYSNPLTTGMLRFTPGANLSGTATIRITVDDGEGQTLIRDLAVTVNPINDLPFIITNLGAGSGLDLSIGDTVPMTGNELMANDLETPTPANALNFTIILPPSQGRLEVGPTGATVVLTASAPSNTFSSADVLGGLVNYIHTGVTAGTDGFAFTVTDPDGGVSPVQIFTFDIAGLSPPVISDLAGDTNTYAESVGSAVAFDTNLVLSVTDADSPTFLDGFLSVEYVGASSPFDRITIATGGSLGITGTTLTYDGVPMGTIQDDGVPGAGSANGERLLITGLTNQATPGRITTLLQSLRFSAPGDNPLAGTRTIEITVNDGDLSTVVQTTMTVVAEDDPPYVPAQTIVLTPGLSVSGQIQATDPEGVPLTFAITAVPARGNLSLTTAGAYTYTHTNLLGFSDSFGISVSDGTLSTTAPVTIVISDVDPLAPAISSLAPMRIVQATTFSYTPVVTVPVGVSSVEYQLVPRPEGVEGVDWTFSTSTGTLTWPSITTPGASTPGDTSDDTGYHQFGILVIDRTNNRASYQPITLKVTVGGNG